MVAFRWLQFRASEVGPLEGLRLEGGWGLGGAGLEIWRFRE